MVAGFCRGRRRQQDRVMTDTVAAPGLAQPQPAIQRGVFRYLTQRRVYCHRERLADLVLIRAKFVSKAGILQQLAGAFEHLITDENTTRQYTERAFEDAHIAIDNHMRNFGSVEQSFNGRDQDGVVGADKFAQYYLLPFRKVWTLLPNLTTYHHKASLPWQSGREDAMAHYSSGV